MGYYKDGRYVDSAMDQAAGTHHHERETPKSAQSADQPQSRKGEAERLLKLALNANLGSTVYKEQTEEWIGWQCHTQEAAFDARNFLSDLRIFLSGIVSASSETGPSEDTKRMDFLCTIEGQYFFSRLSAGLTPEQVRNTIDAQMRFSKGGGKD